jgi:anaerobic dimethyl sulfoxide reductase subunit A
LKYPLKRVGGRGDGKFERISWNEALDTIVDELNRIRNHYGPEAVLFLGGGGDLTKLHSSRLIKELLFMTGGCTQEWGIASFEGALFASMATYGTIRSVNAFDDILNSRLIIMWGLNPTNTINGTNTSWYLVQAKESGAKIISVDPRYTDSTATLASQWIPIIPGTDTAMLIAMAYIIIEENLHDRVFIDTYTIGFEKFKDYVMGKEDGIAKTPIWAEDITGVPANVIKNLARDYASIKPAALIASIGPGRTAYGEQYHRTTNALSAMTANIGIHGGWGGASESFGGYDFKLGKLPKSNGNPIELGVMPRKDALPTLKGSDNAARIHFSEIPDVILNGRSSGYPVDLKTLLVMHCNPVNQNPNTNKMIQALKQLEFIVVAEQVMTATAKFADILLPVSTIFERNDIVTRESPPSYGYVKKVIEPLYESRSPLEICHGLATRLGISIFGQKTEDEWLREMIKGTPISDYNAFKKKGYYRIRLAEPRVAFRKQIEDLENNPFPTPSGKIEIYSQRLAAMNNPDIPPIPKYIEHWDGRTDPLKMKYPLQIITSHFKRRAHTQFDKVPWLRELIPQAISINTTDAKSRSIRNGDKVRVFNDSGEVIVPAMVTERIMPGVVDLPQGAWYTSDSTGVDHGGCSNVLTRNVRSPGGAACYNTGLVQVEKLHGD